MLLTYGQGAHIPDKLSIFYGKAYEALFERHDALKGGFQRQRLTSLDIQEFARVFAAFCLQTYDKTEYQFSKTSALRYLENCKKIANLNYSASDYLEDALQAVCLLVEDGLSLVFAHRSFQEYFTARFISEANPNVQSSLIKKYREHVGPENVIGLLYEIRPEVVGRYYILPGMDQLVERIGVKKNVRITHYTRYLKLAYRDFVIGEEHIWAFRGTHNWLAQLTYFVVSRCGHLVGWSGFKNTEETIRFMVKKYGRVKVVTADLSYRDNFVKDLGEGNVFQSMETLRLAMRIREAIVEKHRITEASLEEILGEEPGEVGGAKEAK